MGTRLSRMTRPIAAAALALAVATPAQADPAGYRAAIVAEMQTIAHTVTRPPLTATRKGLLAGALVLFAVDGLRMQSCRAHGGRELDPLARPFVQSLPVAALASAAFGYALTRIPRGTAGDAGLAAFGAIETANLSGNWGC